MDAPALAKLIVTAKPLGEGPPAPPRLAILKHAAWREAKGRAAELGTRSRVVRAIVFPIWYGEGEWRRATLVAFEDGGIELIDGASPGPVVVMAVVATSKTAVVTLAKYYAPDVLLALRNKHYAVVDVMRIDAVERIERVIDAPAVAVPKREVAPGMIDAEPAVAVGDLDIAELLAQAVAKVRVARDPGRVASGSGGPEKQS